MCFARLSVTQNVFSIVPTNIVNPTSFASKFYTCLSVTGTNFVASIGNYLNTISIKYKMY